MSRNAFRDFFRRRRVSRHFARHGNAFDFHGVTVHLPEDDIAAANALIRNKYEREEAALIGAHLAPDLPVIELGGSLGVVSALIRSRLAADVRHLIVEANPSLVETCAGNAARRSAPGATEVLHAALHYDAPVARFRVARDVHSSAVASGGDSAGVLEVPAVTLADLHARIGSPDRFNLVSDIEGAEFELFRRETGILRHVDVAIVELHPRTYRDNAQDENELFRSAQAAGLHMAERRADVVLFRRAA